MTEPELDQIGNADREGTDRGEDAKASWDGIDLPEWGSEGWVPIGMFGLMHDARGGQIVGLPHGAEERMVALADFHSSDAPGRLRSPGPRRGGKAADAARRAESLAMPWVRHLGLAGQGCCREARRDTASVGS